MEHLPNFGDPPAFRVCDAILLVGISVNNLRKLFLEERTDSLPEVISVIPPSNNSDFYQTLPSVFYI
jgi:hypothetical protein